MKYSLGFAVIIIVLGIISFFYFSENENSITWKTYKESNFSDPGNKKGIIIDFYADWCVPCKEMDKTTFLDKKVISEVNKYLTLKADMTKSMSPEVDALRNKFQIDAMPTILVFSPNWEEIKRITGYANADEFHKLLSDLNSGE